MFQVFKLSRLFMLFVFARHWSRQLTSSHFILYHRARFLSQHLLSVHPPIFRITAHVTVPSYQHIIYALIQMNGA